MLIINAAIITVIMSRLSSGFLMVMLVVAKGLILQALAFGIGLMISAASFIAVMLVFITMSLINPAATELVMCKIR